MEAIGKILNKSNNVINVNKKNLSNNDNNVNQVKRDKYALDRTKFIPNTPETQLAEEIAVSFNDLENYAAYLSVIKKIGCDRAYILWKSILDEIEEKRNSKYPIRYHARYFMWRYKKGLY